MGIFNKNRMMLVSKPLFLRLQTLFLAKSNLKKMRNITSLHNILKIPKKEFILSRNI